VPILSRDKPLWVYANVVYLLDEPVSGAGYYYGLYSTDLFNLSSLMAAVTPEQLASAGVKATLAPSRLVEDFQTDWEKEWYSYKPADWARTTRKIFDPHYAAPAGARLALAVQSAQANKLVVGVDAYAAEVQLKGGPNGQSVVLSLGDFKNAQGEPLADWTGIKELRLGATETLKAKSGGEPVKLGGKWQGEKPVFQTLRWELAH
jgi:hypothetical protein